MMSGFVRRCHEYMKVEFCPSTADFTMILFLLFVFYSFLTPTSLFVYIRHLHYSIKLGRQCRCGQPVCDIDDVHICVAILLDFVFPCMLYATDLCIVYMCVCLYWHV